MNDLQDVQGTWRFASLEVNGETIAEQHLEGSRLTVSGDAFTTVSPEAVYRGKIALDATVLPRRIDLLFEEGPHAGESSLGIYELSGETWRICLGLAGETRPQDFRTEPESGHALEMLHRL
ncbi:MAG: TIGR03067 domain-containing protein [Rhodothermales bacterium]